MLKICNIESLLPHEEINLERLVEIEAEIIKAQQVFPILVDQKFNIILDGHHRWEVLKKLGFPKIPAYFINYTDNNLIEVYSWQKNCIVTKKQVIDKALSKNRFTAKTTKHIMLMNLKLKSIKISECL